MRLLRHIPRRAATLASLFVLVAACGKRDPSGPVIEAQQLALDGDVTLHATLDVPESRGPGAVLGVNVTLQNRTAQTRSIPVGSSSCPIFVRILAAAPGAGASATFYDDSMRACTRDLRIVTLPPGGTQAFRHVVPVSAIAASAPDELQAHIGMHVDEETVLLVAGPFRLP